jgi:hypothetical protein
MISFFAYYIIKKGCLNFLDIIFHFHSLQVAILKILSVIGLSISLYLITLISKIRQKLKQANKNLKEIADFMANQHEEILIV